MKCFLLLLSVLLAGALAQSCQCDSSSFVSGWAVSAVGPTWLIGFEADNVVGAPQLPTDLVCAPPQENTTWAVTEFPSSIQLTYNLSVYPTALSFVERSVGGGLESLRVTALDAFSNVFVLADIASTCNCSLGSCTNCSQPLDVSLGVQPLSPRISQLTVDFGLNVSSCVIDMYLDAIALEGYTNCSCCGNGLVEFGETCDDGNSVSYNVSDGCDATCHTEAGWVCSGEPSVCVPLSSNSSSSASSSTSTSTTTSSSTTTTSTGAGSSVSTSTSTTDGQQSSTTTTTTTSTGSPSTPTVYLTFVFTYPLTNLPNYPTQEQIMQALMGLSPSAVMDPRAIGFYSALPTLPPGAFIVTVTINATVIPPRTAQQNADAFKALLEDPANQKALGEVCVPKPCTVDAVETCTSSPPCASPQSSAAAVVAASVLMAALLLLLM